MMRPAETDRMGTARTPSRRFRTISEQGCTPMTNRTQRLPALMTVLLIAAIAACTGPEQFANNADSTAKNVASSTTATEEVARSIDGKVAPSQQTQTNDSYLRF